MEMRHGGLRIASITDCSQRISGTHECSGPYKLVLQMCIVESRSACGIPDPYDPTAEPVLPNLRDDAVTRRHDRSAAGRENIHAFMTPAAAIPRIAVVTLDIRRAAAGDRELQ
jgi:hypothetical protein